MTTYLAFNEADGLDTVTGVNSSTGVAIASVARGGFRINSASGTVSNNATIPTALTECWIHVYMNVKFPNPSFFTRDADCFEILDTAGTQVVGVRLDDTGSQTGDVYIDTANSTVQIGSNVGSSEPYFLSFNIKLDATTGFIKVYDGTSLVLNESNIDTTVTSGITQLDTLVFKEVATTGLGHTAVGTTNAFGQVVVSDKNTIGCRLFTLTHTAGSINDWDSGAITDVDEAGIDDGDKATTTTNGDEFTMDTSDTLVTPTLPNKFTSVIQAVRMGYDSGSAVTKATPFLNDTTATSTSYGTQLNLTTGILNYQQIWDTDPSDSGDWDETRINNYEFGVRADT